ncbi:GNAT family N-acetyltransferase [Idiomarina ramblicola]|uniref:tRNA cytosine(34) acetyltransferase TmcA n=1 Tax=Idiomarina ramblicola TaxID=263724 RepID=A0A432YTC2_9GAMM|nr:GNAT family N-acetyltransferase [Idiomarina ramblicola]RUO64880.1 tRNA cytosine(34) acetyltransferase TmcA [Idiomarina ramblicola]
MSQRSGYRKLELLHDASLWQQHCQARPSLSIYLSDKDKHADAALSRYRDYLGHEFEQVFIDCSDGLHADAIAALCGTVTASGLLSILLPVEDNPMSQRMTRCAAKFYRDNANNSSATMLIETAASARTRYLTDDQQTILQILDETAQDTTTEPTTHIITAERGRGKSTLLGRALAKAKEQRSIIVTAPRKANAKVLLQQAPQARFVAWDKLLEQPDNPDTQLIIDEAAGLPLWATEKLCQKFTPWLLATTVAGYEGCGRGFAVHFTDWARSTLPEVHIHQLTQPLRWPVNDPLEQWLAKTFLLDERAVTVSSNCVTGTFIQHASELEESLLQQCFQLLLNAHYQSSPNDLNLLLTEPAHKLAYRCERGKVIAVAWLMSEGPVNSPLKQEIKLGRRRPKGNLLPQAIGYFLQQDWAMDLCWLRVARIAVSTDKRRRGTGSQLLTDILQWAKNHHYQMLGTSFAWSPQLDQFWQKNSYFPWRFSSRIDSVSARSAAIYVCSCIPSTNSRYQQFNAWGELQLQWLSKGKEALNLTEELADIRADIIKAYCAKIVPFDAAHFALAQWFYWQHNDHPLTAILCRPDIKLKQLGQYWGGLSKQQANENLCKEVDSLR